MEIKMQRTKIGMIQTTTYDDEVYYCLEQVLERTKRIKGINFTKPSEPIHINGKIIYNLKWEGHSLIYSAFIEEAVFNTLIKGVAEQTN
jgi:hypothetical protein